MSATRIPAPPVPVTWQALHVAVPFLHLAINAFLYIVLLDRLCVCVCFFHSSLYTHHCFCPCILHSHNTVMTEKETKMNS